MSSSSGMVDVLVIGSGAAGGALAERLAEKRRAGDVPRTRRLAQAKRLPIQRL